MDELVQWLRAQLDEDERIALEAGGKYGGGQRWWEDGRFGNDGTVGDERGHVVVYRTGAGRQHSAHIAHHDPARVLREIDAKRRLLAIHRPYAAEPDQACLGCAGGIEFERCPVLRLLALPYADRPGYREEWRP